MSWLSKLLPPKILAISVAQIPVIKPGTGPAPEAIERAMERGTEIKATVSPDFQLDNIKDLIDLPSKYDDLFIK